MATADPALEDLKKAARTRAVRGAKDDISGVRPRYVATPASTDEVAEVLRVAARHDLTLVTRGAGSKMGWGTPPRRADLVVDTARINGVVEHAAGDLVVTVRAGTPVAELQAAVAGAGQQLALDTPLPAATVGGTLAVGTSGPRRLLYGTARDLLIGITFVRGDGVVAKAGGKVVKNVAGYDFGKLLTGSFGTLGVITEAVFRLHPLPAARRAVTAICVDAASAGRAALAVLGSQVVPTAVELDARDDGSVAVTVLIEGVEAGVEGRTAVVLELFGTHATEDAEPPATFGALPFAAGGTGLKVTSSLTGTGPVLGEAQRLAHLHEVPLAVRGSAAGVLYAGVPEATDPEAVGALVADLRVAASAYDGSLTVLTAPGEVRDQVDVWGPVPGLAVMRRLKDELDPAHRLSPGRFVGGI